MHEFHAIFGSGTNLTIAQVSARAMLIFAFGLVLFRLAGRRTFATWSALDITVSIIVGSALSRTLTGNAPLVTTLIAVVILLVLHWIVARLAAQRAWLSRLVEGRAIDLARNGRLSVDTARAHTVSAADLQQALHSAGLDRIEQADRIVLEPNGKISVLRAS